MEERMKLTTPPKTKVEEETKKKKGILSNGQKNKWIEKNKGNE